MTQETQKTNYTKYEFADVAARLMNNKEDTDYVYSAADLLRENLRYNEEGEALYKEFVIDDKGEFVSEEARNKFINIYYKKYFEKKEKTTISQLYEENKEQLNQLSEEQRQRIKKEFEKVSSETYGSILKKLDIAKKISELPDSEIHPDRKKQAKETLKEYSGISYALNIMEEYGYEEMRYKAIEKSKNNKFNKLEQILKQQENEQ